jgi:hypothetical protein
MTYQEAIDCKNKQDITKRKLYHIDDEIVVAPADVDDFKRFILHVTDPQIELTDEIAKQFSSNGKYKVTIINRLFSEPDYFGDAAFEDVAY